MRIEALLRCSVVLGDAVAILCLALRTALERGPTLRGHKALRITDAELTSTYQYRSSTPNPTPSETHRPTTAQAQHNKIKHNQHQCILKKRRKMIFCYKLRRCDTRGRIGVFSMSVHSPAYHPSHQLCIHAHPKAPSLKCTHLPRVSRLYRLLHSSNPSPCCVC
jgi:hypothetical protein